MANFTTEHVPLPSTVENLITSICEHHHQTPPQSDIRRKLAAIGENHALQILHKISRSKKVRNLNAYIVYMINEASSSEPPPSPTTPISPNATPGSATRRLNSRQGMTQSPVVENLGNSLHVSAESGDQISISPELVALGELEFRKAFLLLSYIGRESLEKAISADKIRSLKYLPMLTFEKELWEAVGKKYNHESERQLSLEWDSGRAHVYHCYVSPEGSLRFKGPILHNMRTHLQKSLGDDNVLVVKFSENRNSRNLGTSVQEADTLYRKFSKEGICVGLRLYRFFVFKDGGKEEKKKEPTTSPVKCYFVRMESYSSVDMREFYILTNRTMFEARSLFMHVHTLASVDNYMARFSLILSKTLKLDLDLATVDVQDIPDVYCQDDNGNIVYHNDKPRVHTDGTGFISEDLAVLCPNNVSKGRNLNAKCIEEISNLVKLEDMNMVMEEAKRRMRLPPLLIQCRLFHMGRAIKGTLLVNRKLPPRTIQVRHSMIKVETDWNLQNIQSINSMEVVGTSDKPKRAYLSRYLIALLSYGGVPNEFFMDVLRINLEDAEHVFSNKRAALRASINHGEMDEFNAARMILSGIPLDEPFLQYHLSILAREEKKSLKGGKLHLPDCFYVMGTADPTRLLERDQVCIIHENGQITGDVLVYRNPGLHFGDIHVLRARYIEELESYVGHSKYAIFFPCVGPRSLADEIGGGDYDGDMYWVSNDPQLLQYFRKSDPWIEIPAPCNYVGLNSSAKKPSALSADELENELFSLFLERRFQPSNAIGMAADSWMALMDRLLTLKDDSTKQNEIENVKENMLKLVNIYYEAIDGPKKTGRKIEVPNYLRAVMFPHHMERDQSFTSTSILGLIYDEVERWQSKEDLSRKEIWKLPSFDVKIPQSCMEKWEVLYGEYRIAMTSALNSNSNSKDAASEVIKFYKRQLYDAAEMEDSPKNLNDIYREALAVYHVTYNFALQRKSVSRCGFAWKIAGSALISLFTSKQNEKAWTCAPSVLCEIFG